MAGDALATVRAAVGSQALDQEALRNVLGVEKGEAELSLLYGETPLESVAPALAAAEARLDAELKLKGDGSETFLDIGCGRGHVVLAAAAARKWKRCSGIELVQAHVDEANKAVDKLKELESDDAFASLPTPASAVDFLCADFKSNPAVVPLIEAADVIYCFDMAFPPELRRALATVLSRYCKEGALVVVTHTDRLPSADFVPVGQHFGIPMEWGTAPARVFRKTFGAFEAWLAQHEPQLQNVGIPKELWAKACVKLIEQRFDIGSHAQFAQIDGESGMVMIAQQPLDEAEEVFVVDHCLTFQSKDDAAAALEQVPHLRERLLAMADADAQEAEASTGAVLDKVKGLLASYAVVADPSKPEEKTDVYYMLDEIGSRLRRRKTGIAAALQEGQANFKLVPIYSFDHRMAFSLAWPVRDVKSGEILFADHEQGWDLDQAQVDIKDSVEEGGSILPEMKEYSAQAALTALIAQSREGDASSPAGAEAQDEAAGEE